MTRALQVLQVPVFSTSRVPDFPEQARDALSSVQAPAPLGPTPQHVGYSSLQLFLHHAGALFGCDPDKWERQGRPKTEYSEANQIR
jgi:hypothetical protein